jgi:hypothetical protein
MPPLELAERLALLLALALFLGLAFEEIYNATSPPSQAAARLGLFVHRRRGDLLVGMEEGRTRFRR